MKFFTIDSVQYFQEDLEGRRKAFIKQSPDFKVLEEELFKHGGTRLIYMPEMPCPKEMVKGGEIVVPEVSKEFNFSNRCHDASYAIATTNPEVYMWTGFSLSDDGLWRYHSWISTPFKAGERFIEVTGVSRIKCFGVRLTTEDLYAFRD